MRGESCCVSSGVRRLGTGSAVFQPPGPHRGQFLQLSTAETSLLALWLLQLGSAAETSISHNCLSFGNVIMANIHIRWCLDRTSAFLA